MTIKRKVLLALIILVLFPTLLAGLLIYRNSRETLIETKLTSLEAIAEIKHKSIQDFALRYLDDFRQVRAHPALEQPVSTLLQYGERLQHLTAVAAAQNLDAAMARLRELYLFDTMILTDASGRVLYRSGQLSAQTLPGARFEHIPPEFFADGRTPTEPLIRFYYDQNTEQSLILAAGFLENAIGQTGILALGIDLRKASPIILDSTGLGESGRTVLGKKIGLRHFVHLTPSLADPGHSGQAIIPFASPGDPPLPMQRAVSGESGAGRGQNYLETPLLAVWHYLPEFDIGLVAKIDAAEALAPVAVIKATTITILLFVILAGIIVAQALCRSITAPLETLRKGIAKVGEGRLDYRLNQTGNDEVGQLARSFDEMTEKLAEATASRDELDREIADRKQMEKLLRDKENQLRDLFDNASDLIQSVAPDGRLLFVNRTWRETLGYSDEEIKDLRVFDVIHPDSWEHCQSAFRKLMENQGCGRVEAAFRTKDGRKILLEGVVNIQVEDGQPVATRGIFRDITERRQLEEQLRHAEKMQAIGQLAGGIAHDFNNQLSGVLGYAELLLMELEKKQNRAYAEQIKQAAKRSSELTQKLLDFSRKGKILSRPVDLHKTIDEVAAILARSIDKRIRIQQTFNTAAATVTGDPAQLQNMLLNMGINAADAMPNGGELIFETTRARREELADLNFSDDCPPPGYLKINIIDSGCGMDEATRQRIFEPFFTTKPTGKGTGMGLASVYGTVMAHKGHIEAQSERGAGTTMRIFLPLSEEPQRQRPSSDPPSIQAGSARILVVDDEEMVRRMATQMLRTLGYQVVACSDGQEAVDFYRSEWNSIDLVILDMVMPGLDGKDTFDAMRQINPAILAILSSGYSLNGRAQQILDAGVQSFVSKPFTMAEISETVANCLKKSRDG